MHTDTPFYRLFQERPATVFELAGLPVPPDLAYRLHAEEVKQTAFRLDGVLLPKRRSPDLPAIFVETQFYPQRRFYARWLASIFLYLYRHPGIADAWRGVVVFPDRATDRGEIAPYEPLLACGLVHRVYLEDLLLHPTPTFGARLARLTVLDTAATVAEARTLLAEQPPGDRRDSTIDLVETILVYKFPTLTREEIRLMLHLPETDLKKTRFYQDVFREGRQEGRQEGERALVLRQLRRRLGGLTPERERQIGALPPEAVEALGEALLDFTGTGDLDVWLASPRSP